RRFRILKKQIFRMKNFLLLALLSPIFFSQGTRAADMPSKDSAFRDWERSLEKLYGVGYLKDTHRKTYCIIHREDTADVVRRFDPAGTLINTTVACKRNGKIWLITEINRWGEHYDSTWYIEAGPNRCYVIDLKRGAKSSNPCAMVLQAFENGLLVESKQEYADGSPCTNKYGLAVYHYQFYSDPGRYGLLHEVRSYDQYGNPVTSAGTDSHQLVYEYSEDALLQSVSNYGVNGQPVHDRTGIFRAVSKYDHDGNEILQEFLNEKGDLQNSDYGLARIQTTYKDGFESSQTRMDPQGKIVRSFAVADSVAIIRYKRDEKGNVLERAYYDEKGLPVTNQAGIARIVYSYDDRGLMTSKSYFDDTLAPADDESAVHEYHYQHDSLGRIISTQYFNREGLPCKDNFDQAYMQKMGYDSWGRKISTSYWENPSTPMERWNHYHQIRTTYDSVGQPISYHYLNQRGEYTRVESGYSRQVLQYNKRGMVAVRAYFDGDVPVTISDENSSVHGYQQIRYEYDSTNRITALEYAGPNGDPAYVSVSLGNGNNFTCRRVEFIYAGNRIITERIFSYNLQSPSLEIDCLKSNYINSSGVSTHRVKQK
ncbi:MAG: hypothetical protein JST96_16810, partial [Bacteroidetes bacterium]|nr:hypothetical protein [Bacteroidota bacterium]